MTLPSSTFYPHSPSTNRLSDSIMEIIAALTSVVACFWSLPVFEFGLVLRHIDDPDSHTRVQLAPDADE